MKLRKNTSIFLFLLLIAGLHMAAQSPQERYTKVLSELKKISSPAAKIDFLVANSYRMRRISPNLASKLSERAIVIADESNTEQGKAYASYGARQINLENYEGAIQTYQKALEVNEKDGQTGSKARNYKSIGHCYQQLLEYDLALENFQKSLTLNKTLKNDKEIAIVQNKIGKVYFEQKNYSKALTAFQEALKIAKKMGDQADVKRIQNNINICKARLGNTTAAPTASRQIESLGIEEQFEIIKDSLAEAQLQIKEQQLKLQQSIAELMGLDTNLDEAQEQVKILQDAKLQLEIAKKQKERELILYLIIAVGAASTILIIALLILRNNRIRKKANQDLELKNEELTVEKKKTDDLLLNILPESVADELKNTGKVKPKEYRDATMLFTDFKGFTRLTVSMSPEELINELNTCFEAFDDICANNNLEKIKTIGDAYMAVSGVPHSNPTHVRDTVRAALEMQAFMRKWRKEKVAEGKPYWELRIGIHTGSVIAGVIGKHKFVYDIWGDAVNIASRMESSGEAWEVNISEQTYLHVKDKFECEYRGKVPIKHKGAVDMYFVKREI